MKGIKLVTLTLGFYCAVGWAQTTPPQAAKVAVYHIEGMLEKQRDELPYNQVLAMLDRQLSTRLNFLYFHTLTADEIFSKKNIDCLFPVSSDATNTVGLLESVPLHEVRAYFLSTQAVSTKALLDPSQPARRIGFREGNTFGGNIDKLAHHTLIPVNPGADVRNMLAVKRLDIFIGYFPDSLPLINALPDSPLLYNEESFLYAQQDRFLCHDTPPLRALIDAINQQIKQFKHSGELHSVLQTLLDD